MMEFKIKFPEHISDEMKEKFRSCLRFHKKNAPGIYLGVYMVELGLKELGEITGKLNVAVETTGCLSDSIQVLTGCTYGNKYLRTFAHFGKFACTFFDRETKKGVRVHVDVNKIDPKKYPYLYKFMTRTRTFEKESRKQQNAKIIKEIFDAEYSILTVERVKVDLPAKPPMLPSIFCKKCGEFFLKKDESDICHACKGRAYYIKEGET